MNYHSYKYIKQKLLVAWGMLKESVNQKCWKKFLVSNIFHVEFMTYIRKFTIVSILD